ncbi:MAG TPA: penicillin-binding protein 1C [Bacteroidia bacterium]|jgi:penicillin-binding protein 1C|nr:penicillin-binding protein 1C [Bacteroidia bacterium]HMU20450.1 penicillin-binding protein 1C [Bacteroidia bacterium]
MKSTVKGFRIAAKKSAIVIAVSILLMFVLAWMIPLNVNIPYAVTVTDSRGEVLHAFLSKDEKWRMKVGLNEISPQLVTAIIQKEDRWFNFHYGVNPVAVVRALVNNLMYQRKTSGASTITMQVSRLLYPAPRTLYNKIIEAFRAVQLECRYSKKEILELYLNLIPYGGNIEGVEAASVLYLNKLPSDLSLAECVALCIIPNRPSSLRPGYDNDLIRRERNKWLTRFEKKKIFKSEVINDALNEPVEMKRQAAPALITQLAYRLREQHPSAENIHSTLRAPLQHKVQSLVYNYSKRKSLQSIYNASAIVIDNKSHKVVAYIGSADFKDQLHHGQVDGVNAVRSPGSSLKPLIYAMAFDKGLATPLTVINDVPVNFMGYNPENYNSKFNGRVTLDFALSHSLNIPAVKILNQLGVPTVTQTLIKSGFNSIENSKNKLGLSLALGGCGVRLCELSNLYATFANNGVYQKLKYVEGDTLDTDTVRLLSSGAAFMTTEILSRITRPDLPDNYANLLRIPHIAWKTGTSYGRRDAWSIGYNKRFTVGVWLGNYNGNGVAELSGASVATPLLFDIFNAIDYDNDSTWYSPPADVNFRLVCSETGLLPGVNCSNQIMDEFLPGITSNAVCTHLKEYIISPDEKICYCTSCMPAAGYKKKLFFSQDAEYLSFLKSENISPELPPPHNPACTRVFTGQPPRIVSPNMQSKYLLDLKGGDKIMLQCQASPEVRNVYWYINNLIYRAAAANEQLFCSPPKGLVKISCADDMGRNSDIFIKIEEM